MSMVDSNADRLLFSVVAIIVSGLIAIIFTMTIKGDGGLWSKAQDVATDAVNKGSDVLHEDPQGIVTPNLSSRLMVYYVDADTGERLGGVRYNTQLEEGASYSHDPPDSFDHNDVTYNRVNSDEISGTMGADNVTLTVPYRAPRQTLRIRYIDDDTGEVIQGMGVPHGTNPAPSYKEGETYSHAIERAFYHIASDRTFDLADTDYIPEDPNAPIIIEDEMGKDDVTINIPYKERRYEFSVYYVTADGSPIGGVRTSQMLKKGETYQHTAPTSLIHEGNTLEAVDSVNLTGTMDASGLSLTVRYDKPGVPVQVFYRDHEGTVLGSSQQGGSYKKGDSYTFHIPASFSHGEATYDRVSSDMITGVVGDEPVTLYADYTPVQWRLRIYYTDADGKRLGLPKYEAFLSEGEPYSFTPDPVFVTEDRSFLVVNPATISGTMPRSDKTIEVPYKSNGLVEVYYTDASDTLISRTPAFSKHLLAGETDTFATARSFTEAGVIYRRLPSEPETVSITGSATGAFQGFRVEYEAAPLETKEKTYDLSRSQSQTHTMTIPDLLVVESVTVDDGTVNYSVNGNTLTFTLSGSGVDSTEYDAYKYSQSASTTEHSSSRSSLGESTYYSSNGYSGTIPSSSGISSYQVESGGYYRDIYETRTRTVTEYYDATIPWCYSPTTGASHGNLPCEFGAHQTTVTVRRSRQVEESYQAKVGEEWIITYSTKYKRSYSGTIYKGGDHDLYRYKVTVKYRTY